ncbi:MAG: septum site-determining protein MinC [Thiomicrorhabdus sp.]|nr:septum site-determining protein MinC [Thiomicrorhabdus sp.]
MSSVIEIKKSDFSLPIIQLLHDDLSQISDALKQYATNDVDEFFSQPCVLSIAVEDCQPTFLAQLVELLRQLNFIPVALQTDESVLEEQAHYLGLAVFNRKLNQMGLLDSGASQSEHDTSSFQKPASQTHTHHGHVSAGEQLYAEGGDLIVLGDVEAGAEVIADGNIYIGGCLNGKAYAANSGSMNVDEVTIRAYSFEPELISIAGFYQLKEDIAEPYLGLPVKARFVGHRFVFTLE